MKSLKKAFSAKRSFSQVGEDIIADFYLPGITRGTYVDVGANDPVEYSNTYAFYKKGWRGLLVEPNPDRIKLLRTFRPRDVVVGEGVSERAQELSYHMFRAAALNTFSATYAEKYEALGHKIILVKQIQTRPLAELLNQYLPGKPVHILSTDTEGYDLTTLQTNDWNSVRPLIVIAEVAEFAGDTATRSERDVTAYMQGVGYGKLADTYINAVYVERKYARERRLEV